MKKAKRFQYSLVFLDLDIESEQTSDCWSRDIPNFDLLKKGLVLVFLPCAARNFSRKIFLFLYAINWPIFIVRLSLLLEISSTMCILIVCYSVFDVITFQIYLAFLFKPFSYMIITSEQKFKYLKNKKSF